MAESLANRPRRCERGFEDRLQVALLAALVPVVSSMAVSGVATFSRDWPSALTPSNSSTTAAKIMNPAPTREEIHQVARRLLEAQVELVGEMGGKVEEAHLRMGRPAEEILRLSEEMVAGLVVVGNQGLSGRFSRMRRFLMGGVSENVTRYAGCSVMVVRKDLYDRPST
jgi:nucleotide-binding universal stress UspA family protein